MRWLLVVLVVLVALPAIARAGRTPAESEALLRDQAAPKLDLMCGMHLGVRYDVPSLAGTDVEATCEEPLRFLYYACQSSEVRRTIQLAHLRRYECRGKKTGKNVLEVEHGEIVLDADVDSKDMRDALADFKEILHAEASPFSRGMDEKVFHPRDAKWEAFMAAPVPTPTATDYCVVDGKKLPLPPTGDPLAPPHVSFECVHGGKVVTQMSADGTGFQTRLDGNTTRLDSYKHGFPDGEAWVREKGVVTKRGMYADGRRVWESTFEKGKLSRHESYANSTGGSIGFDANENVTHLECGDGASGDPVLRSWCGFDKPRKVFIKESGNERTVLMTNGLARIVE